MEHSYQRSTSRTSWDASLTMLNQKGTRQSIGVLLYATGSDIGREITIIARSQNMSLSRI